jgi:hypothetical protein
MAYITTSNFKRIIQKINLKSITESQIGVYKKPIYFLSKWETNFLLSMQSFMGNPEDFYIDIYKQLEVKDTYKYVFESELAPAYHTDLNCERLHSTYKNFEIPFEIIARVRKNGGNAEDEKARVVEFRNWFKSNIELFQNNPTQFLRRLDVDWNVYRKLTEIAIDNSGNKHFENYNLGELENEIDRIIYEAGKFFTGNPDKQNIIRRFQKLTFLAYKKEDIENNDTQLNDQELKAFLKQYDTLFKKPIIKLLIEYYRVKLNPNLSFEGKILEKLNFRECSCCKSNRIINESKPNFEHKEVLKVASF